jgi:voltage-gated potassium channel
MFGKLRPEHNLLIVLGMLGALLAGGTVGYRLIEGWSYFDSLYMTVITLATVGYSETGKLSTGGRAFTIFLIGGGVVAIALAVQISVNYVYQSNVLGNIWRRRMQQKIDRLKNHAIVCGYGNIGKHTVEQLMKLGVEFLVVDREIPDENYFNEKGIPFIAGDATDEDVLQRAGIERASTLVALVGSDADNLFITMSAVAMKPGIRVVSRAEDASARSKLLRAGADKVVLPYEIGGRRIAALVSSPSVVELLDIVMSTENMELRMVDIPVGPDSKLKGRTLVDSDIRKSTGTIVLAIRKSDGKIITNPPPDTRIELDDRLICLGTNDQVLALRKLAGG